MTTDKNCIFCQIVARTIPAHTIWESKTHLAFLSIFPNTEGFTVVIPKKHYSSYAFEQNDQVLSDLIIATKQVARILDHYFTDVSRVGMFFEGFGVDHLHSKLFPMHGTGEMQQWAQVESKQMNQFFKLYPGYLCSNDSHPADNQQLAALAQKIKSSYQN